jgi:chromosomal replication initiator protein
VRSVVASAIASPLGLVTQSLAANDLDPRPNDETDTPDERFEELRTCDVLVIEDVQHLPARSSAWLVRLLDTRTARRQTTIITANAGPARLHELDRRLTSRLSAGLVVSIDAFSAVSRKKVLRIAAKRRHVRLANDALDWLAEQPTGGGLRPLLGTLDTLKVLHGGSPILLTREHVQVLLASVAAPSLTIGVTRVVDLVANAFHVKPKEVLGKSRLQSVMIPRHVAMWLTREVLKLSLPAIGDAFQRDHSTVLHAIRKVNERLTTDALFAKQVAELRGELS